MPVESRFAYGGKGEVCARFSGWLVFERAIIKITSVCRIQQLREISGLNVEKKPPNEFGG